MFLARPLLELLQTPNEIIEDAYAYLVIVFMGIPATILFNLLSNIVRALGDSKTPLYFLIFACLVNIVLDFVSNIVRALGDSKTPLYFLIFACLVNIVLDFVLILTFHMGVAGAGLATILAQLLSGILCIIFIVKKVPLLWVKKDDFRIHPEIISTFTLGKKR